MELLVFRVTQVPRAILASRENVDKEVARDLPVALEELVKLVCLVQLEQLGLEVTRVLEASLARLGCKAKEEIPAILDRLDSRDRSGRPVKLDRVALMDPEVPQVILDRKVHWGSLDRLVNLVSLALLGMLVHQVCQDLRVHLASLDSQGRVELEESLVMPDCQDRWERMADKDHPDYQGLLAYPDLWVLKDPKAHRVVEASLAYVDCQGLSV